jgi:hypothetical protein
VVVPFVSESFQRPNGSTTIPSSLLVCSKRVLREVGGTPVTMAAQSSSHELDALARFVSTLTFNERKALITLARSQSIPESTTSPILFSKTQPILDKLVVDPPFHSLATDTLSLDAMIILRLLSSPLTTGILIVYALGVELSDSEVARGKLESFNKELLATQAREDSISTCKVGVIGNMLILMIRRVPGSTVVPRSGLITVCLPLGCRCRQSRI